MLWPHEETPVANGSRVLNACTIRIKHIIYVYIMHNLEYT